MGGWRSLAGMNLLPVPWDKFVAPLSSPGLPWCPAQTLKNLPQMQETRVQSLDWEDPLKKGTATHPSTPAWEIPWTEEPGGLQSVGSQRVRQDWVTDTFTSSLLPTPKWGGITEKSKFSPRRELEKQKAGHLQALLEGRCFLVPRNSRT